MAWARKIAPARKRAGLTQEEVARAAEVSRNTLAAMEQARTVPQAEKLWRVLLALDLRPDAAAPMTGHRGVGDDAPEWLREWWRALEPLVRGLPEERRGEVMGQVVMLLGAAVREARVDGSAPVDEAP